MKNGMQEQEQAHGTTFARYKVMLIREVILFFFFFYCRHQHKQSDKK